MEDMNMIITKQTPSPSSSSPSPLSMHKHSQTISKIKPKIRIIHIFAPEIIKTDVANFRNLVQSLTGKPSDHRNTSNCENKKSRIVRNQEEVQGNFNKKVEIVTSNNNNNNDKIIKEEEEEEEENQMWNGSNSGGFLAGFADLDGFIQELDEGFPMLPMEFNNNHQMQYGYGESQLV